jgi:thiol-disulfide isomerase/thioredoxin
LIPFLFAFLLAALKPVDEAAYQPLVASHRGEVLLVDFWATWCDPCREELPKLAGLQAKLAARRFRLVTVSCDEPEQSEDAEKLLRSMRLREPFYLKRAENNDRFINSIDPQWSGALPALFLYGRHGRLVRSFVGEVELADVEAEIRKLL